MIGKQASKEVLQKALRYSQADQTEAKLVGEDLNLTRFANSTIHQNMNRQNAQLQVRVVCGKKIGTATTNNLDDQSIRKVVEKATLLAKMQEDDASFVSLPSPAPWTTTQNYYESTANYTAQERARDIGVIADIAKEKGFFAFGAHITTQEELAVMNSLGVDAYNASTYSYLRTVIEGPQGTGYADFLDRDVRNIEAEAIGREAVERCAQAQNPRSLATGTYEVVFLPYAVADIIRFPAYIGFAAQPYHEGRSYMAGKMGTKIMGDNISIWDDGADARTLNMPFDVEGVPKKRVDIIQKGVATGVVYDSKTAQKHGKQLTGHASYRRGNNYEAPTNLVMANGNSSVAEMIKATKKGLLVTRFHYTHCPEPREVVMTGTTRDGIFYIENGEVKYPVFNMRLTDSVLRMFSKVDLISQERKLQRDWWSTFTSYLPAIHVTDVHWTGSTSF